VISLGTPWSAGENFGCTWEHLGALATSLGAPVTSLGASKTSLGAWTPSLGARMTNLGAPGSASNKPRSPSNPSEAVWENEIFFGNGAGAPRNHSYYLSFNDFYNSCIQFVFSSLSLYSYPSTHSISGLAAGGA